VSVAAGLVFASLTVCGVRATPRRRRRPGHPAAILAPEAGPGSDSPRRVETPPPSRSHGRALGHHPKMNVLIGNFCFPKRARYGIFTSEGHGRMGGSFARPSRLTPLRREQMANIKVAFVNESTVLKDADVAAAIPVLQTQVNRDFAPAWGID